MHSNSNPSQLNTENNDNLLNVCSIVPLAHESYDKKLVIELINNHLPTTLNLKQDDEDYICISPKVNPLSATTTSQYKVFLLIINFNDELALLKAQQLLDKPHVNQSIANWPIMLIGNRYEEASKEQYDNGIKMRELTNLVKANPELHFSNNIPLLKKKDTLKEKDYNKLNLSNLIIESVNKKLYETENILQTNQTTSAFFLPKPKLRSRGESTVPLVDAKNHNSKKCTIL